MLRSLEQIRMSCLYPGPEIDLRFHSFNQEEVTLWRKVMSKASLKVVSSLASKDAS